MLLSISVLSFASLSAVFAVGGFDDDSDGGHSEYPGSSFVNDYDYVFVGGGSGSITAAYWLSDMLKRANRAVSIAVIEKNDYLGGNVFDVDLKMPAANRYDGSFGPKLRGGIGPLRTTQLAMGLKRRIIAQNNLTLYFTPFRNWVNMRGVSRQCRDPIEKAFSGDPGDAYAYGDFCNNDLPYVNVANDDAGVFRGFSNIDTSKNPSDLAWRYVLHNVPHLTGDSDLDANDGWIFDYGGVNPWTSITCESGVGTPQCPFRRQNNYDWKTFLERELRKPNGIALNQNYSDFMLNDNVGFTGDFDNGFSARSYLEYNLFEWNTNSFNGYLAGAESQLIDTLVAKAKSRGVQFFTSERVKAVNKLSTTGFRYSIATSKRNVRARNFVGLNLPPFYLFERMDQDLIVEYDGVDLGGDIIKRIRATREANVPQPARAIKIIIQYQPGVYNWHWDLLNNAGNYSTRQYGTTGCTSRIEFEDTPKHRCTNEITVVYSDRLCRRKWQAYAEDAERTGNYATFGERINEEMRSAFPHLAYKITMMPVLIKFKIFNSAWHIGKMSYDDIGSEQLAAYSAQPLGSGERVSLIGEAYYTRRSGWIEGAMRSAKRTIERIAVTDNLVAQKTAMFNDLFNLFRDSDGGIGDSSAFTAGFAGVSAMGYMPTAYAEGDRDPSQMSPNEVWGPYGNYANPAYRADSCRPSLYGIKIRKN